MALTASGNGSRYGGNSLPARAWYLCDAGSSEGGLDALVVDAPGATSARLWFTGVAPTTAVPELSAWALLIFGFAAIGLAALASTAVAGIDLRGPA